MLNGSRGENCPKLRGHITLPCDPGSIDEPTHKEIAPDHSVDVRKLRVPEIAVLPGQLRRAVASCCPIRIRGIDRPRLALETDELRALGLAVLLQPVRVGQAGSVVGRILTDSAKQDDSVAGHGLVSG